MKKIVNNIEWDVNLYDISGIILDMPDKEASDALGVDLSAYEKMCKSERIQLIKKQYEDNQEKMRDFIGLPEKVFVESDQTTDSSEIVDAVSEEYGWCIRSCGVGDCN